MRTVITSQNVHNTQKNNEYNFVLKIKILLEKFSCKQRYEIMFFSMALPYTYSVALVRKRTIPTERKPLVGEVSANFCG
jgi:hypothetical protein